MKHARVKLVSLVERLLGKQIEYENGLTSDFYGGRCSGHELNSD